MKNNLFFDLPFCEKKYSYYFSYFIFILINLMTILVIFHYLNNENCGDQVNFIRFIIFCCSIFISYLISRTNCMLFHTKIPQQQSLLYDDICQA